MSDCSNIPPIAPTDCPEELHMRDFILVGRVIDVMPKGNATELKIQNGKHTHTMVFRDATRLDELGGQVVEIDFKGADGKATVSIVN